jgi:hypothetical protein
MGKQNKTKHERMICKNILLATKTVLVQLWQGNENCSKIINTIESMFYFVKAMDWIRS